MGEAIATIYEVAYDLAIDDRQLPPPLFQGDRRFNDRLIPFQETGSQT